MDAPDFLFQLMLVLLTARVLAELAVRLKSPSVIGELLAGVVLGPSLLGWLAPDETIRLLAEIGIILLLFEVGLETDVRGLARTGGQSLIVAVSGFVLPFLFGFGIARGVSGLDLLPSLFVGGTLTATSIGITVRVLADLRRQASTEGQVVLGAAVLDDVMGVVLLALLYEFSTGGGISLVNTGKVLLFVGLFFILAAPVAKVISVVIKRFDAVSEVAGLVPTTIVALVLFFAWLAHAVGAPELLGGFAAGLALSLNLREVVWSSGFIWIFSGTLLLVAVLGKLAGALLIPQPWPVRWVIGTAMIPRGEVGLIFAELGRTSGILDGQTHAGLVIVIALTTLLPPFAMKWLYRSWQIDKAA